MNRKKLAGGKQERRRELHYISIEAVKQQTKER